MALDPGQDVCQIGLWIVAMEFSCLDDGQDIGDRPCLTRQRANFSSNSNPPFILPMSVMKSKSIIAGIRISAKRFPFAASKNELQVGF